MVSFHKIITSLIQEKLSSISTEEELELFETNIDTVIHESIAEITHQVLESIKKLAFTGGLEERKNMHQNFVERNYQRWNAGFDALELLISVCIESGEIFNKKLRPQAAIDNDILFDTLVRLHAKGCLIANEILCLLVNGFPDGAQARWRALHEISVTALFLAKSDSDTVNRYLLHEIVESYKGATQHKKYAHRLQAEPPSDEEIGALKLRYDELVERFGKSFTDSYGWVTPTIKKNRKIHFADIEEAVKLDHWRPYYKWASQNIHANVKTIKTSLGLIEAKEDILLVGQSNSGMVDPAHSMALSLTQLTACLLSTTPTIDNAISMNILQILTKEVGELFLIKSSDSLKNTS